MSRSRSEGRAGSPALSLIALTLAAAVIGCHSKTGSGTATDSGGRGGEAQPSGGAGGSPRASGGAGGTAVGGAAGEAMTGGQGGGGRTGLTGGAGGGGQAGGCVALTCDSATCFPGYCGDIGDGCGGVLHCPTTCPDSLYRCEDHLCTYTGTACFEDSCTSGTDHYCGTIGIGAPACLESMECPPCPAGWQCQAKLCVGIPGQCTKRSCTDATGTSYCGSINDGCGGLMTCDSCPIDGWLCQNDVCVGPPDICTKGTCSPGPGINYCGMIGDGCGGTLTCPATCGDGTTCGGVTPNACGTDASTPPPPPAPT